MSNKLQPYLELAKRRGFVVLEQTPHNGHHRLIMKGLSGIAFKATLAGTPSDIRGPQNWVRDLKKAETKAIQLRGKINPKPFPNPDHHSQRISDADQKSAKAIVDRMKFDPDTLLTRKEGGYNGNIWYQWFLNNDRTTNKGMVPSHVCNYLYREGYIQLADTEGRKEIFSLTAKAGATFHSTSPSPKPSTVPMETAPSEEPVQTPPLDAQEMNKQGERRAKLVHVLLNFTDDEIQEIITYGIEIKRDELLAEIKKRNEKLDVAVNALSSLSV